MTYTVGEVARIARISVRTLHHYDEIGLVKPSGRSAAGYRFYTDTDLDRLQQVLFFRELELKLDDIVAILDDPGFDRRKTLIAQRALLLDRIEKHRVTLALVEKTIRALDGEVTMTKEEMFELEAKERWGDTEAYRISKERTKRYGKDDWARIKAEQESIFAAFAELAEEEVASTDVRAMDVAERHRLFVDRTFYPCARAMHAALGQMYVDDPRFAENFDKRRPGLAEYVRDAVIANARR
jgi:DNA-binding transcriptional MerR regulator